MKGFRTKLFAAMLIAAISSLNATSQGFGFGGFGSRRMNMDSLNVIASADYSDMLSKLGLKESQIREGRQPNSQDISKQPNYNELIANPYPYYPDALTTFDGRKVKSAKMWDKIRRPELVREFEDEMYGRIPDNVPSVSWTVTREEKKLMGQTQVIVRYLTGTVDNSSCPSITVEIQANVVWPDNGTKNFPVIMEFSFMAGDPTTPSRGGEKSWQQQVVERGWAACQLVPSSIQGDNGYSLTNGIIGLCNKGEYRKPTDWGSLRAWGWGASRMIDYFETEPLFDATKVAIEGVSRYGKASIVAMAFDERIASGFIASSGKGGVAGWRRDCGESIGNITSSGEYHWMCGNFIKYGADPLTEDDLRIDQHELIALCAPRPCFISGGSYDADKWQDIMGMFISTAKASPVYELLGKKGIGTDVLPPMDYGLTEGELAWRQHHGGHEAGPNWPYFLDFFDKYVVSKK